MKQCWNEPARLRESKKEPEQLSYSGLLGTLGCLWAGW